MTKPPTTLQDLRRKIYIKAKSDKTWRFWGIYAHVCKLETLKESYRLAKQNNGAPGIDGVTFEMIEAEGADLLLQNLQTELMSGTYYPMRNRLKEIPKGNDKFRTLAIPAIRDRIIQGALKLILEPIFEADFKPGSYGYRPKKTPQEAVEKVAGAIIKGKTRVIDVDLKDYFGTIQHHVLLSKIAKRVNDPNIMKLLKRILKAGGKRGVSQGGPLSPFLSNVYLTSVDEMLERAKEVTKETLNGKEYVHIEYSRWADDIVILVDQHKKWDWLFHAVYKRLQEELDKIGVTLNMEKTKIIDLEKGESFPFLGFDFKRVKTRNGKEGILKIPKIEARTKLLTKLREVFRRYRSQPISRVVKLIEPILRGWTGYFRIGNASKCFGYIKDWVEKKVRRHLMKARQRQGFGWGRWSRETLYKTFGLYNGYKVLKVVPSNSSHKL